MPQISLYIDDSTLKKIEDAAKREHLSISKWVARQLKSRVNAEYPRDFEDLFGSVAEADLSRPAQPPLDQDFPREPL